MLPSLLQWAPLVYSPQDRLFTSEGFHSITNIHHKKKSLEPQCGQSGRSHLNLNDLSLPEKGPI